MWNAGERIAGSAGNARSVFELLAASCRQDDGSSASIQGRQRHLYVPQHAHQVPRGAAESAVHLRAVPP